jgi:hypothetical protein
VALRIYHGEEMAKLLGILMLVHNYAENEKNIKILNIINHYSIQVRVLLFTAHEL